MCFTTSARLLDGPFQAQIARQIMTRQRGECSADSHTESPTQHSTTQQTELSLSLSPLHHTGCSTLHQTQRRPRQCSEDEAFPEVTLPCDVAVRRASRQPPCSVLRP